MTPAQWERVKEWFERLEDASAAERAAALAAETDETVAKEAARLLDIHAADCPEVEKLKPQMDWVQEAVELRAFRSGDVAAGRFKILRFLAAGGMGEVYEAEDTELNERVALKTLRPELAMTESAFKRFKQEIQLSRKVTHANVCRIHDFWQHTREGGRVIHFLTMELLSGETLAARMARQKRMSADEALPIIRQIVDGLEAAHAAGVVHRDLKPSNVMIVGERVVITDFGLSRSLSAAGVTMTGSTLGTPAYMAPEQIESGETGPATDIYSLGVLIYEMVTGVLPFRGGSAMALAVKKLRETPVPPSSLAEGIAPHWDHAILACLAQEPAYRFQSARGLLGALEDLPGAVMPPRKRKRVATWVWKVAFAASLAVLAALLYWQFRPRYQPTAEALRWYEGGVVALHEESFFKARQLLEKAVEADARFAAAHVRLAQALMELDMADRAREELLRAADLKQQDDVLVDAVRKMVLREFGEAAKLFQQLEPGTGAVLDTARAMALDRNVEAAVTRYLALLKAEPENAAAWLQLGMLQQGQAQLDSYAQAEKVFRLRSNIEGLTAVTLRRSEALRLTKRISESEQEVRDVMAMAAAVKNEYLETEALGRLGALAAYAGRFAEARMVAGRVGEMANRRGFANLRARSLYDLGFAYLAQFQYREAEEWFRLALEAAEQSRLRLTAANARTGLAQALLKQGKGREAEEVIGDAIEYYRRTNHFRPMLSAQMVRVDAQIEIGKNEEAMASAKAIYAEAQRLRYAAEGVSFLLRVAHMHIVTGEFPAVFELQRQAREEFLRLGRIAQYVRLTLNHATLQVVAGDVEKAREAAAEAAAKLRQLRPEDGRVEASKLQMVKASLALAEGKGADALEALRTATMEPKAAVALTESRALLQLQRPAEALRSAKAAFAEAEISANLSDRTETQCGLAAALLANRDAAGAIRQAEAAIELEVRDAQRLRRFVCRLVLRSALLDAKSARFATVDRAVKAEFEALTRTWPAALRQKFRQRADLRNYLDWEN